jgi:hypothetical protein
MSRYEQIGKAFQMQKQADAAMRKLFYDSTLKDDTPYNMYTFGLKQCIGTGYSEQCLDADVAQQNMKHFIRSLNRFSYGNNYHRTSNKLTILPVLEYSSNDRFHHHILIQKPKDVAWDELNSAVTELWGKTLWSQPRVHIASNCDIGAVSYVTKLETDFCQVDTANQTWI